MNEIFCLYSDLPMALFRSGKLMVDITRIQTSAEQHSNKLFSNSEMKLVESISVRAHNIIVKNSVKLLLVLQLALELVWILFCTHFCQGGELNYHHIFTITIFASINIFQFCFFSTCSLINFEKAIWRNICWVFPMENFFIQLVFDGDNKLKLVIYSYLHMFYLDRNVGVTVSDSLGSPYTLLVSITMAVHLLANKLKANNDGYYFSYERSIFVIKFLIIFFEFYLLFRFNIRPTWKSTDNNWQLNRSIDFVWQQWIVHTSWANCISRID